MNAQPPSDSSSSVEGHDMLLRQDPSTALPNILPTEIEHGIFLVDTLAVCMRTVEMLLEESSIAIDVEGVRLGRAGEICLIQICAESDPEVVYVFDVIALKQSAFTQGGLGKLLTAAAITKLVFDGRKDNDALYHQYGICMTQAYDVQVLWALKRIPNHHTSSKHFLKGLQGCMEDARVIPPGQLYTLGQIQKRGKSLFAPHLGGSYDVWKERPLRNDLIKYCSADVKYLFALRQKWGSDSLDTLVLDRTQQRIRHAIECDQVVENSECARVDFSLEVCGVPHAVDQRPQTN